MRRTSLIVVSLLLACASPRGTVLAPTTSLGDPVPGSANSHSGGRGGDHGIDGHDGDGDHGGCDGDHGDDDDVCVSRTFADVSSLSGAEALARDTVTGAIYIRSLRDPLGAPVELARITGASISVLGQLADAQNSDLSGIAVDPADGRIVMEEEAFAGPGSRIVLIDPATLATTTLFALPWTTNPASNGTGLQQYAFEGTDGLFFWDSTRATVFRLSLVDGSLDEVVALDPGVADGQHVATAFNDLVLDPATGTVLIADGASDSILEVDPVAHTTTTLFSGIAHPHALALAPNGDVVVGTFDSVLVGRRSGGALSVVQSGFTLLGDLLVLPQEEGCGTTIVVADKGADIVEIIHSQRVPPVPPISTDANPGLRIAHDVDELRRLSAAARTGAVPQ